MIAITLIAAGRLKHGPEKDLFDLYAKRLRWKLTVTDIDEAGAVNRRQDREQSAFLTALDKARPDRVVALDERGRDLNSLTFAQTLSGWADAGSAHIGFVIGGADGLTDPVRARAQLILRLGSMTWPHLLVRGLLMEQLYRAQQILAGHPYHRE